MIGAEQLDNAIADLTRRVAQRASCRGLLARAGQFVLVVVGASALEVLPVGPVPTAQAVTDCTNYLNCGMSGYPCAFRGGGTTTCPSGTVPAQSWTACCCDGTECYNITYRDCCYSNPAVCCKTPHGGALSWCRGSNGNGWCPNAPQQTWCNATQNHYKCALAIVNGVCQGGDIEPA